MAKSKKTYRASIRIDGTLVQKRFTTKADHDEWYAKMRQQKFRYKAGLETEFEPQEFEVTCAYFIRSRMKNETWKHDKYRLEHYFFPKFRGRMIHSITRKEWKDELEKLISIHGLKPKTHNMIRQLLISLYNHAIQDEPRRAQVNPILEIKTLPVLHEEMQFFHTPEECQRYLTHAQALNPMYGMFAFIALNTGMREGEIISLRNECADLQRKTIHIMRKWSHSQRKILPGTKGRKERTLGINDSLLQAFTRHRKWSQFNAPEQLVICNLKGGPFDSKHLWEMHCKVIDSAKLPYIVIHGLRHTYATQYLASGGNMWDLKNILGHQSIKTTERYSHVIPLKMQERSNVFEVNSSKNDATVLPIKKAKS